MALKIQAELPRWVSSAAERESCSGESIFRFSPAERRILRKRRPVKPSVWAERHRKISNSVFPGPWRNSVTPYLTDIMDSAAAKCVETVIIMACPQSGKTEAAHNFVGYSIDRDPGPVMYVFPDRIIAQENADSRILPMITESGRLRSYMTGVDDDATKVRIKLQHLIIYLAWSGSPSSLSNKPCKIVVFDEVDNYQEKTSKLTDSISLGERRATTYRSVGKAKIFKISTPSTEDGNINVAFTQEAQVRFHRHFKCPFCDNSYKPSFDHIKFPKDERDPERVLSENLAYYQCPACSERYDDETKRRAVSLGFWLADNSDLNPAEYIKKHKPKKVAFHIPAWVSTFVPISEIASAFLKGLRDKMKYRDFMNNYCALPWVVQQTIRKEDAIIALRDDRPRGRVPGGGVVAGLVAGVDTQDNGFWYEIRAFGYGLDADSWQVREGFIESFQALERILFDDVYEDSAGTKFLVHVALMDAMGHRTAEVYDFCRRHLNRVIPSMGVKRLNQPFTFSPIEYYPGSSRKISGGLRLCRISTTHWKNALSGKLDIAPGDPGQFLMHSETTREWCRQMVAETLAEDGTWQNRHNRPNHAWDCSVLSLVAAEVLGMKFWQKKIESATPERVQAAPKQDIRNQRRLPKWFSK